MKKKLLMLLLSVTMVVTMMPSMAWATPEGTIADTDICKMGDTGYATIEAAVEAFNAISVAGDYKIEIVKAGTYQIGELEIVQSKTYKKNLTISAAEGTSVVLKYNYPTPPKNISSIFNINAQSSFNGGSITFKGITFDLNGGNRAVSAIAGEVKRYAHDITVKNCSFVNTSATAYQGYIFGAPAGSSPRHFVVDNCTANNINQVGSGYFYCDPLDTENPGITIKDTNLTGCKAVLNNQGAGSYSVLNKVTATDCSNPLLIQISGGTKPAILDVVDSKLGSVAATDNDKNKVGIISARYSDCVINITNTTFAHPNCATLTDVWAYDRDNGSGAGTYGASKNSYSVKVTVNNLDNGGTIVLDGKTASETYRKAVGQEEGYGGGAVVADITPIAQIGNVKYMTLAKAVEDVKDGETIQMLVDEIDEQFPDYGNVQKAFAIKGIADGYTKIPGSVATAGKYGESEKGVTFENINWTASFVSRKMNNAVFNNCKFTGEFGVRSGYAYNTTWTFNNCVFEQTGVYAVHFDEGQNVTLEFNGCELRGKVNGLQAGYSNIAAFKNCKFDGGMDYNGDKYTAEIKLRANTSFTSCEFTKKFVEGVETEKNIDDNGINIVSGYTYNFNACSVDDSSAKISDYETMVHVSSGATATIDAYIVNKKVAGGFVIKKSAEEPQSSELASGCTAVKIANNLYLVGLGATANEGKLTAGKYTLNPIAYVADGYTVEPSKDSEYPYEVVEKATPEAADQKEIVVEQKTEVVVNKDIDTKEEIEAAEKALEDTNVTGVADALTDKGQDEILDAAVKDSSEVTQATLDAAKQVDIAITVKAEVTAAKTVEGTSPTEKILEFELTPYAVVTATSSTGEQVSSTEIEVSNDYLAKNAVNAITVKLGCDFEPQQVLHIREDNVVESFSEGTTVSYADRTFTYVDKVVTLEITQFSEIQLLGEDKYANVSFDATTGTGTMETVSVLKGSYNLPKNTFTAPTGKKFAGWKINGEGETLVAGHTVTISEDITLYAVWEDDTTGGGQTGPGGDTPATFTITFDANGGTGTMESVTKPAGKFNLPKNGFTAPAGKQFAGWKIGDKTYEVGDTIEITANTTIVAVWEFVTPAPTPKVDPYFVAKAVASGKTALAVSWTECEGASEYVVYANKCNVGKKKYSVKKIATTEKKAYTIKKISGKKLAKNTFYKVKVVALDANGKKIATANVIHAATGGYRGKYGNVTSITAKAANAEVTVGEAVTVGAAKYKIYKNKKAATTHAAKLRYLSSNKNVATVNSKGVVTGLKAGRCTIYMQAPNGVWATTVVTVKNADQFYGPSEVKE